MVKILFPSAVTGVDRTWKALMDRSRTLLEAARTWRRPWHRITERHGRVDESPRTRNQVPDQRGRSGVNL